jgi:hypothetical protein
MTEDPKGVTKVWELRRLRKFGGWLHTAFERDQADSRMDQSCTPTGFRKVEKCFAREGSKSSFPG